jgi:septal ring-binding cell division protein DamX
MKAQPPGSYSIQILVACAPETVQKAVRSAPDDRLFVVPVRYQGRNCYRLGWGVYAGEAAARAALGSVPEYFRAGGARARVVSTTTLLP